jgi:hypothetical protein
MRLQVKHSIQYLSCYTDENTRSDSKAVVVVMVAILAAVARGVELVMVARLAAVLRGLPW